MLTYMHKKRVSYLYRTATTKHPCCIPTLGDSMGAGRIRLTQLQKYDFFLNYKTFFLFFSSFVYNCKNSNYFIFLSFNALWNF